MERARSISKSMLSYLKRARDHKEFLLKETKEFERGKRHLANIMGIESQEMTQQDIDQAIKYLFPSGLFDRRARPQMKHPDLLYKAQKEAQFDIEGRPHHHLFYTVKPNYHETLTSVGHALRRLNDFEDEQLAQGVLDPPGDMRFQLVGMCWLSRDELQEKFLEPLLESEYEYLIKSLDYLIQHPYAARERTFIEGFTKELIGQTTQLQLPELMRDEKTGQIYTDIVEKIHETIARVRTVLNGSGQIDIDGHDILYFKYPYLRRALYYPLQVSGMLDKVDIKVDMVRRLGDKDYGCIARITRFAVSKSIAAYVDEETRERMRVGGLLTLDNRRRERKKFGQMKARRKYTWKKR